MHSMKLFYVKGSILKNCYEPELRLKRTIGLRAPGMKDHSHSVIFFFLCSCVVCLTEYDPRTESSP